MVKEIEGSSVNLTVQVFSSLPLISEPMWSRMNGALPPRAAVTNFIKNEIIFTSLALFNLSSTDDNGNYSLTASNRCGSSSFIVHFSVKGNKKYSYIFVM